MEARHQLQIDALKLFFEHHDIEVLHEIRRNESYTFVTDAVGFTHVQLRNLTNYARVGISLWVENGNYTIAVNVYFI